MDDDDAKFLIDQFNKFASWRIAGTQFEFSKNAILVALLALGLAVVSISWQYTFRPTTELAFAGACSLMIVVVAVFVVIVRQHRAVGVEHDNDVSRLLALEEHYSRFKSLPSITLAKLVDSKFTPEDLEKFLKESEPTDSPKT
ncbi:hypothetical protein MUP79_08730 [Candidatus Bathyarchaeota archaeon]|nr:hypothetical protein [Candidatus Bathyarchaeota archaeon]